jgi:hypothetical protein
METVWVPWQSPNNQYWGLSNSTRATLESGGAQIFEIPGIPDGAITYAEGAARGWSQGYVNWFNGEVAAAQTNELMMTTALAENFGSQSFYVSGKLFTQVDGVITNYSPWFGTTVINAESKLGFANAPNQAAMDGRFFALPLQAGVPGVLSNDEATILITSAAKSSLESSRLFGQVLQVGGAAVAAVTLPWDIANGIQAYQGGGPNGIPGLGLRGLLTAVRRPVLGTGSRSVRLCRRFWV